MTSEPAKTEPTIETEAPAHVGGTGEAPAKKTRTRAAKPARAAQAATRGRKPAKAAGGAARGRKAAVKPDSPASAKKAKTGRGAQPAKEKRERTPRADSKQAQLIAMLRRPEGVTVDEAAKAFGWQPHTVRGALYGALTKRLGFKLASGKVEERGRVYRIAD